MKKTTTLVLASALTLLTGCASIAKIAKELKDDPATVDVMTLYGSFHRSVPTNAAFRPAPPAHVTTIKTNVTVSAPVTLQIQQIDEK